MKSKKYYAIIVKGDNLAGVKVVNLNFVTGEIIKTRYKTRDKGLALDALIKIRIHYPQYTYTLLKYKEYENY